MKLVRVKRKDEEFSDLFESYIKAAPEIKRVWETINVMKKRLNVNILLTKDYWNATKKEKEIWDRISTAYHAMDSAAFNFGIAWHMIQEAKR